MSEPIPDASLDDTVSATLAASRALVGVAARSLVGLDDEVTLAQFRTLVLMDTRGPQTAGSLAADLAIHPSTATRLFDRLERKGLICRTASADNRREVTIELADPGRRLVADVTAARRAQLAQILIQLPHARRRPVIKAFQEFAAAAGEAPETAWMLGWQ
jgi:DNA-binding MarR family transcriptional regulator